MKCEGCGTKTAARINISIDLKGNKIECCDQCGNVSSTWNPDVYWPGKMHENSNITDNMGRPIFLESKRHKAQILREKGMSEAGDRYHGTRSESYKHIFKEKARAR